MENTATLSLEEYRELIKCKQFFETFRNDNYVFVGCTMNFEGLIDKHILTSNETIKEMAYNLGECKISNDRLGRENANLRSKIKILENKKPWYKL